MRSGLTKSQFMVNGRRPNSALAYHTQHSGNSDAVGKPVFHRAVREIKEAREIDDRRRIAMRKANQLIMNKYLFIAPAIRMRSAFVSLCLLAGVYELRLVGGGIHQQADVVACQNHAHAARYVWTSKVSLV